MVLIAIFFVVTLALAAISGNRATASSTAAESAVLSGKDEEPAKKEEVQGVKIENKAPIVPEVQVENKVPAVPKAKK